jgi:hypothetical protein
VAVHDGCFGGVWLEQAHADDPPVVLDALDRVSVQLELGHDGGREVNPAGAKLGKRDRLLAGLAQPLEQPQLLGVSGRHRSDSRLSADQGRLGRLVAGLAAQRPAAG